MQKVGIVIVNWNTGKLLAACLDSLRRLPEFERGLIEKVVVVDNASVDESFELARRTSFTPGEQASSTPGVVPVLEFISLPENVGFAKGSNIGAQKLSTNSHVLLLNPDTEVRAGALREMMAVFDREPRVGIVGPKLLNPDGSVQPSVRPFPSVFDFLLYILKLGRVVQSRQEAVYDYSKAWYVDQVMGAAFLIRRETWNEVGALDEGFFTLFEEVDYCKRVFKKGWKTYFTPAAQVMHVRAASFNQLIGLSRTWPWMMSSLHYARKHFGVVVWLGLLLLTPLTLLLSIPASLKHVWLKYSARRSLGR